MRTRNSTSMRNSANRQPTPTGRKGIHQQQKRKAVQARHARCIDPVSSKRRDAGDTSTPKYDGQISETDLNLIQLFTVLLRSRA